MIIFNPDDWIFPAGERLWPRRWGKSVASNLDRELEEQFMKEYLEPLIELGVEEMAALNRRTLDAAVPTPGAQPGLDWQEFRITPRLQMTDPEYERSPERAVESLRRYCKDCTWVIGIEFVTGIGIEIAILRWIKPELLRRLPNKVNGFDVCVYDESSHAYLKIGEDLEPRRNVT